jgi:transposase
MHNHRLNVLGLLTRHQELFPYVKYLPPYSPELNLIEILWRFMKYYWLPFSAYMSFQDLLQSIEDILTRFGTDYTIAFEIK